MDWWMDGGNTMESWELTSVDGEMDGWMIGGWVDGKGEWMGGWVAFEDSTDMLHHFPDPIIITPFLPAILLSFLPSTIPQAIIH